MKKGKKESGSTKKSGSVEKKSTGSKKGSSTQGGSTKNAKGGSTKNANAKKTKGSAKGKKAANTVQHSKAADGADSDEDMGFGFNGVDDSTDEEN